MGTSELFRYIELAAPTIQDMLGTGDVARIDVRRDAADRAPELEELYKSAREEQRQWAQSYYGSKDFLHHISDLTYPLGDLFSAIPYPDLPTADHLIAAIPADIEADERYQADYQRLLASLLALRILGISGAQRQLI
ncbi:MAG: hypothetical protein R3293_16360, partial [Candidatus Promineifilaceae bacterium]|nr:hypothetical protein [Candidatus Promineifilaceae bacterium]